MQKYIQKAVMRRSFLLIMAVCERECFHKNVLDFGVKRF